MAKKKKVVRRKKSAKPKSIFEQTLVLDPTQPMPAEVRGYLQQIPLCDIHAALTESQFKIEEERKAIREKARQEMKDTCVASGGGGAGPSFKPMVMHLEPGEKIVPRLNFDEVIEKMAHKMNSDAVNHPPHYNAGKIEVIEFIEDQQMGYHTGNLVKYIARAGKKDPRRLVEDLEKAAWYLRRVIELERAKLENRDPVRPNEMNR